MPSYQQNSPISTLCVSLWFTVSVHLQIPAASSSLSLRCSSHSVLLEFQLSLRLLIYRKFASFFCPNENVGFVCFLIWDMGSDFLGILMFKFGFHIALYPGQMCEICKLPFISMSILGALDLPDFTTCCEWWTGYVGVSCSRAVFSVV